MMRFLLVCLSVLTLSLAWPPASYAASAADAKSFIDNVGKQTLDIANNQKQPLSQRHSELEKIFLDNVDLDWVAKFVLGKYWRDASDEQKARYLQAYRQFASKSYSSKFDDYNSVDYKIDDAIDEGDGRYVVRMTINRPKQQPVAVDYRVRDNNGKFVLYDITVEGVSMITSQRSEFGAVASRKGIDGLVADLQAKASFMDQGGKLEDAAKLK